MIDVAIRQYKQVGLAGGTLLVSVPHVGVGSLLVTDFILEQLKMDQVACLESDVFPPIAMMRNGKPRAPARIHADAASKVAVLRCEFNVPPQLSAPMARALLHWAKSQKLKHVIALDGLVTPPQEPPANDGPHTIFATTSDEMRAAATHAGLKEFRQGILGGVPAVLLLESKFEPGLGVLALLAVFDEAIQDARSSLAFAKALQRLVPELRFNVAQLETRVDEMDTEVRTLQEAAEKAVERLSRKGDDTQPMFG